MIAFSRLGKLGRLGNQLFQLAATVSASESFGVPAKFPPWAYAKYFVGAFDQSLSIDEISQTYYEPTAEYNAIPNISNLDLFGYFQCEKYFIDHQEKIRKQFTFVEGLLPERWQDVEADCAIHVRRGDYLSESHRFVQLKMDYFNKAIEIARNRGCKSFILCSDDPQWCRQNFSKDIEIVDDLSDIQSLCLMSHAKNHIIANSSLSWWSSWLSANPQKFILAPQIWYGFTLSFRKSYDYQYCPNWELVPNSVNLVEQLVSLSRTKEPELFVLPYVNRKSWLLAEERVHARKFGCTEP